ncbi:MAG TPA: hypothetical protein VMP03_09825 [Methylomirabilota bacterium]|nr:hypothetical protein [Methylomirabilota bacterium]
MAKNAKVASAPRTWISAAMVRSLGGDPVAIVRSGWTGIIGGRLWRLPTVTHRHLDFLHDRNLTAWLVNPVIDEGLSTLIIPRINRRPADAGVPVPVEFLKEALPRRRTPRADRKPKVQMSALEARIVETGKAIFGDEFPPRVKDRDKAIADRFDRLGWSVPDRKTIRVAFQKAAN